MSLLTYITPDDIRGFTRFDDVKTQGNAELQMIAEYTTLRINAYVGHTFESYTGSQKISGNDQQLITLPGRLEALEKVKITLTGHPKVLGYLPNEFAYNDTAIFALAGQHTEDHVPSEFTYNDNQIYYTNGKFDGGFMNVEIIGTWGWTQVPEDVKFIAKLLSEEYCLQRYNIDMDTLLLSLAPFSQQTIGAFSYKLRDPADPASASTGNTTADVTLKKYKFGDADGKGQTSKFFIEVI